MISSLARSLSYLSIGHKSKWKVDWLFPVLLALVSTLLIFTARSAASVPLFSSDGLIYKLLSFVQGLPGFYIAALAAIATFNKLDIDKTMPAPAPKLDIVVRGKSVEIELTRRRFCV